MTVARNGSKRSRRAPTSRHFLWRGAGTLDIAWPMKFFALVFLCLCAGVASPVPAQQSAPLPAIATADVTPDSAIEERLRAILEALGRGDVGVTVQSGVVTLTGDVTDSAAAEDLAATAGRIEGVVAVRNELTATGELSEQINPALVRFRARIDQVLARLPLLILAGVALAGSIALGLVAARARFWDRLAPNAFIAGIYRQVIRIAFALAGLVVALDLARRDGAARARSSARPGSSASRSASRCATRWRTSWPP